MGLFRFLVVFLLVGIILSCGAPPKREGIKQTQRPATQTSQEPIEHNENYLKKAEDSFAATGSFEIRNEWLLKAADALRQETQYEKSLKLIELIKPSLTNELQINLANLISAECLLLIQTKPAHKLAEKRLTTLSPISGYEERYFLLQAKILSSQQKWILASESLLNSQLSDTEKSEQIWTWLQHLSVNELKQAQSKPNRLQPWLQLSMILQLYGLKSSELVEQVAYWQQRYQNHPLALNLPKELQDSLSLQSIAATKVAVLLPLTGRLSTQGLALKEGILAAYLSNIEAAKIAESSLTEVPAQNSEQYRQIRFFDSNLKSTEELNALVQDFDLVIGPLLKENIASLADVLPSDKIMLALNRLDSLPAKSASAPTTNNINSLSLRKEHYFFALAPEDEAQQLAQYIIQKGFKRPIIFTADNSVTSRMTDTFVETWLANNDEMRHPGIAVFSDSKDMREQVEGLLDVAQSKARIKQMENVADVEVFAEERNRQDIDVIILFANPEQTELLNPIIEASLTPSAGHSLSVFASSRSYSLELTKNSLRDLRNLTFSDMPWMLPENPWRTLAEQTADLWPQRQDSLLRLFAMGYDAYELIANLRQLQQLPQVSKSALTGKLNITEDGVLHRALPLAQILQDRVTVLAMD